MLKILNNRKILMLGDSLTRRLYETLTTVLNNNNLVPRNPSFQYQFLKNIDRYF